MNNNSETEARVLRLTLTRKWFDMIASGEKKEEYRRPDKWILSRLVGKHYDRVEFKNGYGRGVPTMEVEYLGWGYSFGKRQWGGGAEQGSPYATIYLGRILNIDMCPKIESQVAPDSTPVGAPQRVWRRRTKGWKMPANTVSVCRPGKWGNPFKVGRDGTAAECVKQYECLTQEWPTEQAAALAELRGKNLACFCKPGIPCHADVLLRLANATPSLPTPH